MKNLTDRDLYTHALVLNGTKMHGTEAEVEAVAERLGIKPLLSRRTGLSTGQK